MSECTGPGCTHPEHADQNTMPAWQYQRRMTHAGDRAAARSAEQAARSAEQAARFGELFIPQQDPTEEPPA